MDAGAGASIPLGRCPLSAPCALLCGDGAGSRHASSVCSGLAVWTGGVCVRPAACVGDKACANLTLQCEEVHTPAATPQLNCSGEHSCDGALIPLGECPPAAPCPLACDGDYACRALTVSTPGACVRPADCVGPWVCAMLQLLCEAASAPQKHSLRCDGSEACYGASIPLGSCPSSGACPLQCSGLHACDGLALGSGGMPPVDCVGDHICANAELQPCLRECMLDCARTSAPRGRAAGGDCGGGCGGLSFVTTIENCTYNF
eukprot:gene19340-biopygen4771